MRAPLATARNDLGMMLARILLIEDEPELVRHVTRGLAEHGHIVESAIRGDVGLDLASRGAFDLLIVDRMLPGIDGLAIVKALRESENAKPILFLSNLAGLEDRVEGLNIGGDDYLGKPFALTELVARVNALLRRPSAVSEPTTIQVGDIEMNLLERAVLRGGKRVVLKPREFALLQYLMRRAGQIVTRTMLLEGVWEYHFDPQTNIVETHISRLRTKIGADLIQTVRGSGYIIRANRVSS